MVHPCIEDKLRFVVGISIIDRFVYHTFSMSSNICSQDVTLGFHTFVHKMLHLVFIHLFTSDVLMGKNANPHK